VTIRAAMNRDGEVRITINHWGVWLRHDEALELLKALNHELHSDDHYQEWLERTNQTHDEALNALVTGDGAMYYPGEDHEQ
jgi:hypothetical protein